MAVNTKSPSVTAGTIVSGQNLIATNELPIDMHSKMMTAEPPLTPLNVILMKLAEDPAHNFRIDWQEKKEVPTTLVVAATESSASTSISVVDNGDTLVKDTLLYNPRNDDLRLVDANETDNTITVTISQGGKTSTVWQIGDVIHVLPPALVENDNPGNAATFTLRNKSVADENVFNFQQIVKLQYGITRSMDMVKTHFGGAGTKRQELKGQKFREYMIKKEKLLYFGGRATGGTAPATRRMAGGMTHYLKDGTLFKDYNGIFTETGFRNFLGDYKDQNPDATSIWLFAAGNVIDLIDDFGLDKVRLTPLSKTMGLDILEYKTRGLTTKLVALPLLDIGITRGWGWLIDMERIRLKTLRRDTFFPEAYNVGMSEVIYDTYFGEYSLLLANESRHAMFQNALL